MTYPGGKGGAGVAQKIINQIPPHTTYIEPFLGSGTIMRFKRPAMASIGIDSDAAVIGQWRSGNVENGDGRRIWAAPGVTVICDDAISFLRSYNWTGGEFVYCDPPYLFETRSSKRPMYAAEFGDVGQHIALIQLLDSLPCAVALSGYWSSLYEYHLAHWRSISFTTVDRGGNVKQEWLWMNYKQPLALHDYSFLGENYREREKLARRRKRWVARLARMEPLERLMLSAAIAESGDIAGNTAGSGGAEVSPVLTVSAVELSNA